MDLHNQGAGRTVRVTYTEPDTGHRYLVDVPEGLPESQWGLGVRLGPPDLTQLPPPVALRLNKELFNRGIITWKDAHKRRLEVEAALRAALKVDVETLLTAYHEDSGPVPVEAPKPSPVRAARDRVGTAQPRPRPVKPASLGRRQTGDAPPLAAAGVRGR